MNNLKLIKVNFAGAKILTREQLREVMGGDDGSLANQCGTYPNCLNGTTCIVQGQNGTCTPGIGACFCIRIS